MRDRYEQHTAGAAANRRSDRRGRRAALPAWPAAPRLLLAALAAAGIALAGAHPPGGGQADIHTSGDRPFDARLSEAPVAGHAARSPAAIAHRGASCCAPENTMAALRMAVKLGADYVEFDVQMSRDGRLVLMHDGTVNRTTNGAGRVGDLTFAELRALDAGHWFGGAYARERIPTFEEVLDALAGRVGLLIDLKEPQLSPGIERKVAAALRARRLDRSDGRIVIQSFDSRSLRRLRTLLPHIPIAVLHDNPQHLTTSDLLAYRAFADALHLRRTGVNRAMISRIHDYGLKVAVWNVRDRRTAARLTADGVDGIIADDPRLLRHAAE